MADEALKTSHIEKLQGCNYPTWRFKVSLYLKTKGLWTVIEEAPPASPELRNAWDKSDQEALNIIVQTLSSSQTTYVINQSTAKGAWDRLEQVNRGRVLEKKLALRRELNSTRWNKQENASQYMQRVEALGEQLRVLGDTVDDAEIASIAIQGLPRSYHGVARTFDVCPASDLTPEKVRYALLREEQRQTDNGLTDEAAYKVQSHHSQGYHNKDQGRPKCYNCGKPGHIARNCFSRDNEFSRPTTYRGRFRGRGHAPPTRGRSMAKSARGDESYPSQRDFALRTTSSSPRSGPTEWSIDSGASSHMTGSKSILQDFREDHTKKVALADGTEIDCVGVGTVVFNVTRNGQESKLTAADVLYVPTMDDNLISVSKLTDKGLDVNFSGRDCTVYQNGNFVFGGEKVAGVYKLRACVVPPGEQAHKAVGDEGAGWHRRMGHLANDTLTMMSRREIVRGLPSLRQLQHNHHCEPCVLGKHNRQPFRSSDSTPRQRINDLLHMDLCGPFPPSLGGSKYMLVIVDDCSRRARVHFLKNKYEAPSLVVSAIQEAETQTGERVRRIRTDNAGEFVGSNLEEFLKSKGIVHEKTIPYSPAQNGVVERMNRTLIDIARVLLLDAQLPDEFWAEAVNTAAHVRNRCSTKGLQGAVPEEVYTGRKPTVAYFKVFGCQAYAWIPSQQRNKLQTKSRPSIFIGYCSDRKGYRLYDPEQRKVFTSRDVFFFEHRRGSQLLQGNSHSAAPDDLAVFYDFSHSHAESTVNDPEPPSPQEDPDSSADLDSRADTVSSSSDRSTSSGDDSVPLRRSNRLSRPPQRIQVDPSRQNYYETEHLQEAMVYPPTESQEPSTYQEALASQDSAKWQEAMDDEMRSLHDADTWVLVDRQPGMKVVKSKWVYRIKRNEKGDIQKYKARLVAVGASQIQGVDYYETFSPVVKLTSLRTLLALANEENMVMRQLDVKTAYLHGVLEEEVFMEQPPGSSMTSQKVCKLHKSIYGLKQSGRTWYQTLDKTLRGLNYKRLETDRCVYIHQSPTSRVLLSVYVDDMLMAADTEDALREAINLLSQKIDLKDLGEPKFILGIEVNRDKHKRQVLIHQQKYITEVLKRFGMESCKPVKTPIEKTQPKKPDGHREPSGDCADKQQRAVPYQNLIGSLMYLAQATRPDIAFATNYLSQFNNCHDETHWKMAKRVLRYLSGTRTTGITYSACGLPVTGYTDASFNEDATGRSRSAYAFTLSKGAVSWKSTRQQVVALSTCEAEYLALTECLKEGKWFKMFLGELGLQKYGDRELQIYCDNQSAIKLIENPVHHQRTKHVHLKYLYARNEIENKEFRVSFISTERMIADALTKPVPHAKNILCSRGLGLHFNEL